MRVRGVRQWRPFFNGRIARAQRCWCEVGVLYVRSQSEFLTVESDVCGGGEWTGAGGEGVCTGFLFLFLQLKFVEGT